MKKLLLCAAAAATTLGAASPAFAASSRVATMYHRGASDVSRLDASLPLIMFGNVPPDSNSPNFRTMPSASFNIPSATIPRSAMNVSRPQSRNQGYPAMTVIKGSRCTT